VQNGELFPTTSLSAIACQILPFALFLSKGNEGFDKLSANGNLLKSVPLGPGRNNSDYNTATNAVMLGSDPDSAPKRLLRHHRITESGSDPNITAPGQTRYQLDSCQRFLDKRCRPFFRIARHTMVASASFMSWPAELGSEPNSG
jgi:hypothetical protein